MRLGIARRTSEIRTGSNVSIPPVPAVELEVPIKFTGTVDVVSVSV